MTGAESTGRNPVTFPKRARECAFGFVTDRCRHLRQGSIRRAEALACQTKPQLAQEAERRKTPSLRKIRTRVARETCASAASSFSVQGCAGALNMAVTALAEDDDASSRNMPLDDADCSKCRRSIITKRAVASSVAIAVAPGRAACSSSSIACTSIRIRSNGSFPPMLSTITLGKAAVTRLSMAPSKRSRPQISSVSPASWVLVLILIALLYSVLIGAPELPLRLADRTTWGSPCGRRRMLPASSLNVSPQYRSSRQFPLVTM